VKNRFLTSHINTSSQSSATGEVLLLLLDDDTWQHPSQCSPGHVATYASAAVQ